MKNNYPLPTVFVRTVFTPYFIATLLTIAVSTTMLHAATLPTTLHPAPQTLTEQSSPTQNIPNTGTENTEEQSLKTEQYLTRSSAHLLADEFDEDENSLDYMNNLDYLNSSPLFDSSITGAEGTDNQAQEQHRATNDPEAIVLDPLFIMSALLDTGIIPLLQEDYFLRTNAVKTQSLLDTTDLGNKHNLSLNNRTTGCDIFYNQMSKGYFSDKSPSLSSYLNLTGESVISRIECCLEKVNELFPNPSLKIDVAKILGLFQDIALQERRLGGMFYHVHRHKNIISRFKFPFYYLERNFFLTNNERLAISNQFGNSTVQQEVEFRKKYFVSDKLGFGDSRIEIETPLIKSKDYYLNVGGYVTLPTAFALSKGMLGSSFPKPSTQPSITVFETLFDLAAELAEGKPNSPAPEKAFTLLRDFVLDAFNRTASNLLDTPLGNDGHVGVALFTHSRIPLSTFIKRRGATDVHIINKTSLEYLFPATEKRFYISKNKLKNVSENSFKNPTSDPAKALRDLQFIEQELINRFFLVAYNTRVQPGIVFHSNTKFYRQGQRWGWNIGTDTWIQTKDILRKLSPPTCPHTLPIENLDTKKAQPFFAYRGRLCGGINYRVANPTNTLDVSLNLDTTLFNSGIGKDFVLFLKIESHY